MLLGAEIGLLLAGIYCFFSGKYPLTKQRVVYGPTASLLGLLSCAPFVLSILFGFVVGLTKTKASIEAMRGTFIVVEIGILICSVAVIYAIGLASSESPINYAEAGRMVLTGNLAERLKPESSSWHFKAIFLVLLVVAVTFIGSAVVIGNWSEIFPPSSTETADSDIDEIPPAPPAAGPVPASLMPGTHRSYERKLKYNRETLAAAYEKIGHKDPKWDEHAHAAMELAAQYFSNDGDPNAQLKHIHAATTQAFAAGCNDPLILYLHARSSDPKTPDANLERSYAKAARAMASSEYPPTRRATAMFRAADRYLKRLDDSRAKAEAKRLFDAGLLLLPVSAREEERCIDTENSWYDSAHDALAGYRKLGYDLDKAWGGIDKVLAGEKSLEVTRLLLKGDFHIQWAWQARGTGPTKSVPANDAKKFDDRLQIARQSLEKSLQVAPHYDMPATLMLTVEKGQSRGREEMEKWFDRAIEFHPSYDVCLEKLEWLQPKWHGSTEEMLAFAHACRDSANWERRYPLVIVDAHLMIANMQPPRSRMSYFRRLDVAADILYVYAKSLERFDDDMVLRTRYAYYCYLCGHPRRAHAQFERIGDKLCWDENLTERTIKDIRDKAANEGRSKSPGSKS
jgi:tetratricopeptide (TPR) repeat protein